MRHIPGYRARGPWLFQAISKRLEEPECENLVRAQTSQLPLAKKRIELRGHGNQWHPVVLLLDRSDYAADGVSRSKNGSVQRGLYIAEERCHRLVCLLLELIARLEATPQLTDEGLGGLNPCRERVVSPNRVPKIVDVGAASSGVV